MVVSLNPSTADSDGDSEDDWEEVEVPQQEQQHLEITLNARQERDPESSKRRAASRADRILRIACHKIHTVCLLANARIRNEWTNDSLLQARLLSLTPLSLQDAFARIHKSRFPDQSHRGHLFEAAIKQLVDWWSQTYFQVEPYGHIRSRTFDQVQSQIAGLSLDELMDELDELEDVEIIRSPKSLMKHALAQYGSRDVSAQLFTALCRALGVPARLVVSLQSVPWQATVKKSNAAGNKKKSQTTRGKDKAVQPQDREEDEDNVEPAEISRRDLKGKGKAREDPFPGPGQSVDGSIAKHSGEKSAPVIKLRKTRDKGRTLGSSSSPVVKRQTTPDPTTTPPVFWTEVYSRADGRWLPVDPIRNIVNKRKVFDPTPGSSDRTRRENRMVYVLAFEEDGFGRDVTPRYAKDYGAKVAKVQDVGGGGRSGGRQRKEWWERVLHLVTRPYRLVRDNVEDEELQVNQMMEGMPTTMSGFKDHPLYALARHLKRDEVIHPLVEIGKFRGEPVYARAAVISLKTAENWMRIGRVIKAGCQPMKLVKPRATTVNKKREIEVALEASRETGVGDNAGEVLQGLYAVNQTELYKPDPIVDGKIPKNEFGNIDLYVPSMLPAGAVHIPFKGTAKIARKLGFDYAEAVTGFEFKKRRAFPVIEGVVVAAENEIVILDAYWEAEQDAEAKFRIKRHERVIKLWARLIQGLRIRQRLQDDYTSKPTTPADARGDVIVIGDWVNKTEGGGFLIGADDVVKAYHLPKYQFHAFDSPLSTGTPAEPEQNGAVSNAGVMPELRTYELETMEDDQVVHLEDTRAPDEVHMDGIPKTMSEMAEDVIRERNLRDSDDFTPTTPPSAIPSDIIQPRMTRSRTNRKATPKSGKSSPTKRGRADSGVSPQDAGPSPAKRGRGVETPTLTPPSGRVLRPRAAKNADKIREQMELEKALIEATEE